MIDDNVNGYIIPQKDSKALTEAIDKFIKLSSKEREEMGRQGRKKVECEFDRQIVVNKYLKEVMQSGL